jgi:hypothetical protein
MLNDSHRTRLRIAMRLIDEKMAAIESRLAHPDERRLMFEVNNDLTADLEQKLRAQLEAVYRLIAALKNRFELSREIRPASRDILQGLPQLWVMLQESDSKHLRGYGRLDPADHAALDPQIQQLATLVLQMESLMLGNRTATAPAVNESERSC